MGLVALIFLGLTVVNTPEDPKAKEPVNLKAKYERLCADAKRGEVIVFGGTVDSLIKKLEKRGYCKKVE